METKHTVLEFLSRNSRKPLPTVDRDILPYAYLDQGIIDSLGIVTMISEFESVFGIQFSADDMQSREFLTVGGLIALIDRLRAQKP
jgi:acyl carrier protein